MEKVCLVGFLCSSSHLAVVDSVPVTGDVNSKVKSNLYPSLKGIIL